MTIPRSQKSGVAAMMLAAAALLCLAGDYALGQTTQPSVEYHIYAGNTHSHTVYTWSHGEQWLNTKPEEGEAKQPGIERTPDGAQLPGKSKVLKDNWQKVQGPPSEHFALAKANGYDFYVVSDHSQEAGFQPPNPDNPQWVATGREAAQATDDRLVAIRGYEHSENDGPDGMGHINVINSAEYLNALGKGIHLQYLYKWLKTAKPNGEGPIVASFNHPGPHQYHD
jgi:hypothetical protein